VVRLKEVLDELVMKGVLISDRDVIRACSERAPDSPRPSIGTLGIVARAQDEHLAASLRRHLDSVRTSGQRLRVIVVDLCPDTWKAKVNRLAIASLAREYGAFVCYADMGRLSEVTRELAASGVPEEVAEYALVPAVHSNVAAAMNAILLDTTGELVVLTGAMVADRFLSHPWSDRSLMIAGSCPESAYELLMLPEPSNGDPRPNCGILDVLGPVLGLSTSELVKAFADGNIRLEDCCDHLLEGLLRSAGVVAVVSPGLATRSESKGFRALMTKGYALSHHGFRHAPCLGIDNRRFNPPFVPVGGAEDLFAELLASMHSDGFALNVPWAATGTDVDVTRANTAARTRALDDFTALSACIAAARSMLPSCNPTQTLQLLGSQLCEANCLSADDLAPRVWPYLSDRFRAALADRDPRYWWPERARRTVAEVAQLFRWWPTITATWAERRNCSGGIAQRL
jgi:hypothetical protein